MTDSPTARLERLAAGWARLPRPLGPGDGGGEGWLVAEGCSQGALEDCWLLATASAVLAGADAAGRSRLIDTEFADVGAYTVRMFKAGVPTEVTIG